MSYAHPPTTFHREAVHDLYRDHAQWLHSWIRRRLGDNDRAADITQDTFVRLISSAIRQAPREPRSYLATVARRVMIDQLRRRNLEQAYLDFLARQPALEECSPEERLLMLETLMQLDAMLDGLGNKARQAFLYVQLDGLTYQQVAEQLGISVSSVTKYMAKATEHCLLFAFDAQL
ncbi:sigma-70 family RNA polymerase sigma factor [Pseudomonas sp. P66]|uniref:Sigma-70 family RNA polymerase sigma factor n=1 Tax=Pseudomonas arcuscaelestis TaxID=2710591 RepID=A0ABS2C351_9PSED|nr:sigma-70 family RNA polymerase sigma factor [Pseudomonas arcuscaelestis]MBM3111401.1 sigma-70 family RNA polymerase sigma factor [Pseudomonas arcuscaelestis]MBM5460299.1 sigma-70 family RNA polymerase sigma factor [Pseudomonas arcuscaelestis]